MTTTGAKTGTEWLKSQVKKVTPGAELPVTLHEAATTKVEAWLQRHDVKYAPPTLIPMQVIDEKRSRGNQARRDAIVQDSVDRFAIAFKAGAEFPPIVCFPYGGKLIIIDGNNRQAGARKAGKDKILGIIISETTSSELIQLLTVEANADHGVTPDLAWRLQQAHQLCSLGFTDAAAAEAAAVTVVQIKNSRSQQEAEQRARSMKISNFGELSGVARVAIGSIKDDPVFYQAASTAVSTKMTTEQVRDMVRHVKSLNSEGAKIEYIGGVAKERGIEAATAKVLGKAMSRVSSPKQAFVTSAGKLLNVDAAALVRQVVTTHDRDQLNLRLRQLEEKVLELQVAMETLKDLEDA